MIAGPEGGPSSDMQRSRAPHEIHYTFITAHFKKSDGRYIEHSFNIFPEILLERREVIHRPRLLSDNGSSYISADLAKWLDGQNMEHVRGAPYHPMTQGKIERWHQTLKNRILLENYYLPGDLETQIEAFVADYNHLRYHESIANLTPADV